ncbi:hypothetical protein [Azospirillum endophyticum]
MKNQPAISGKTWKERHLQVEKNGLDTMRNFFPFFGDHEISFIFAAMG